MNHLLLKIFRLPIAIFGIFCLLCAGRASGQDQKVRLGLEAGAGIATMNYPLYAGSNNSLGGGFLHVGGTAQLALGERFALRTSVYFEGRSVGTNDFNSGNFKVSGYDIMLPLNLIIQKQLGAGDALYFGVGPYVSYTTSLVFEHPDQNGNFINTSLKFGTTDDADLRALDFGGDAKVGFQLGNGCYINLGFNASIFNRAPVSGSGENIRSQEFFIFNLGYFFPSNPKRRFSYGSGMGDYYRKN